MKSPPKKPNPVGFFNQPIDFHSRATACDLYEGYQVALAKAPRNRYDRCHATVSHNRMFSERISTGETYPRLQDG